MIDATLIESIVFGALAGIVYGALWYARKRLKNGEPFKQRKLAATVLVGAGVGAAMAFAGEEVTSATLEDRLLMATGAITLVEAVLKVLYDEATASRTR